MRIGSGAWERGRQGTGYDKLLLAEGRRFDLYLLRFPTGAYLPPHLDTLEGAGHLRLNLVLLPARRGGDFDCPEAYLDRPRIKLFRSDLHRHAVSPIESGTRWVLSLGIAVGF